MKTEKRNIFAGLVALIICVLTLFSAMPVTVLAAELKDMAAAAEAARQASQAPAQNAGAASQGGAATSPAADGDEMIYRFTDSGALPTDGTAAAETYTSVSGEGTLVVTFDDVFTRLTVTGDIRVGGLTVMGQGTLTIGGSLVVDGSVSCNDAAINVTGNASVGGDLAINGGSWSGAGAVEVRGASITVADAAISGMPFFGFADDASGKKTLTSSGTAAYSSVGIVGVRETNERVVLTVSGDAAVTNSTLIKDYPLTYRDGEGNEIEPQVTWPKAYRIRNSGGTVSFVVEGLPSDTFPLPSANEIIGYTFDGWKRADTSEPITHLVYEDIGAVSELYATLTPNMVTVNWLLGYTPDQFTNDAADPAFDCAPVIIQAGSTLSLPTPFRFGYDHMGWQVVLDGTATGEIFNGSVVIEPGHLTPGEGDSGAVMTLEAVWKARSMPIKFQLAGLPDGYTVANIRLRAEGDTDWLTLAEFVTKHGGSLNGTTDTIQLSNAAYGMTLAEYLGSILPGLQIRTEDNTWYLSHWNYNQVPQDASALIAMGQGNLLGTTLPAGTASLRAYQGTLETRMPTLISSWLELFSEMELSDKKLWSKDDLWYVYVNGEVKNGAIANATASAPSLLTGIPVNAEVSFRVLASSTAANATFSLWNVTTEGERLPVTETLEGGYRVYTFKMPDTKVTASFASEIIDVMFNMKESPVSEQRIGVFNGVNIYGVWTNQLLQGLTPRYDRLGTLGYAPSSELDGVDPAEGWSNGEVLYEDMQYFYELPLTRYYYLTTYDDHTDQTLTIDDLNGTHHQWRGGQRSEIYLKDCHMWATTYYTETATLQTQITAKEEKSYFVGKLDKMANLYYYLADDFLSSGGIKPSGNCYVQHFIGSNNIIGCIGTETYGQKSVADRTTDQIRIGARITNNPNGRDAQWSPGGGNYYPYEHAAYPDNFGYWTFGATHDHAWGNVNVYLPHKMLSAGQAYNTSGTFHVRTLSVLGWKGGTLILEDDITENFKFQSISAGATVIVKGNLFKSSQSFVIDGSIIVLGDIFRVGTLTMNNGGSLVANAIEINAINMKGGTVLTNVVRNRSNSGTSYIAATANGDNAEYTGYTLSSPTYIDSINKIAYQFTGGSLYLLGYNTAATTGSSPLTDENNPLHRFANANAAIADLPAKAAELYETCRAVYADNECFFLGNSSSDNRKFVFSGVRVYAAGKMNLNNAANISDGEIYASVLSSKCDLTISGGTVKAREIGNSAAVWIARVDETLRFAKTEITGGTIIADRIGAVSSASESRSSITVLQATSLTPYTQGSDILLIHDALVFYSIDTSKFAASSQDSFALRIAAVYNGQTSLAEQPWALVSYDLSPIEQGGSFATLGYAMGYDGNGEVRWSLSSTKAVFVSAYDTYGNLLDGDTIIASMAASDGITLYAIEVSSVDMLVVQDSGVIYKITANGEEVTIENGKYSIVSGKAVEVTIDPSMRDKVIFGYRDKNGILHNLFPQVSDDGTTVSFSMPFSDCELYVVSRFTLYLDQHEIYFQSDSVSFRTELLAENADRAFHYVGEIYITRNDGYTTMLSHKLQFEDNFDSSKRGNIILHDLTLKMETGSLTNVILYIDGTGGKTVYFEGVERTDWFDGKLTFRGLNGKETDVFKAGNYTFAGRMDLFAFENLHLITGPLVYPSSSVSGLKGYCKQVYFNNCRMDISGTVIWNASGAVVDFNNCEINLSGDYAMLSNCNATLTLKDCTMYGDAMRGFTNLQGALGSLTLDNTKIFCASPTDANLNAVVHLAYIVLKNGSVYNSRYSIMTRNITVDSGSMLRVGYDSVSDKALGRLSMYDLSVINSGAVYAAYVICSGHDGTDYLYSYADRWQPPINGDKYNGITVDGGSIYASEFIGGDYNGKLTLLDGYVEAKYIGTYGKYINGGVVNTIRPFFYNGSATVYQQSKVQILGGTVHILSGGWLGGGSSTVSITDSIVEGSGAVITGTAVTISGADAKVRIGSIISETGSVTITDACRAHFDNSYPHNDYKHDAVAVYIENELRANTILIDRGALVWAQNAYSYATVGGTKGSFTVPVNCGAELYTSNFGYLGGGDHVLVFISNNNEGNQNLWGNVTIAIRYELGDLLGESAEGIVNSNPTYYAYATGQVVTLEALSHPYLKFTGWVDAYGNPAPNINYGLIPNGNVVERYATWELKKVEFVIMIDDSVFTSDVDIENEIDTSLGTLTGDTFVWNEQLTGSYTDRLWGSQVASENLVHYDNYMLLTHSVTLMEIFTADGSRKLTGTHISREMVDAYGDGSAPLQIRITSVSKMAMKLMFHLNVQNGKPGTAQFAEATLAGMTEFEIYANVGVHFNTAGGASFVDEVADMYAKGYIFLGWSSDPNADPDSFTAEFLPTGIVGSDIISADWYAVWMPREYFITINPWPEDPGSGSYYVTGDDAPPAEGAAPVTDPITVTVKYDQMFNMDHHIPIVWREGYVFDSWYYIDGSNRVFADLGNIELTDNETFAHVNFNSSSSQNQPILVFYAEFSPLRVTYESEGGAFVGPTSGNTQEYTEASEPLRGYSAVGALPEGGVSVYENGGYRIISTSGAYFDEHSAYVEGDYRHVLKKNGYTFGGWYLDAECTQPMAVTPRFSAEHITVYAKWTANTYDVVLNAAHSSYTSGAAFVDKNKNDNSHASVTITVQIGELITGLPGRNDWGTREKLNVDYAPRPLWGFVFDHIDPWYPDAADNYVAYFNIIKELNRKGEMMVQGVNRFALPESGVDYPGGATIQMYAAYNEYAIIFMQYYRDGAGNVTQRVIETVQYGAISVSTLDEVEGLEIPLGEGYTPIGWYVNTTTLVPKRIFEAEDFDPSSEKFKAYKQEVINTTYDIVVYHIYAVDITETGVHLDSDPLAQTKADTDIAASRRWELQIPVNMQPGMLCYSFKSSDFSLLPDDATADLPYGGLLSFAEALSYYDFAATGTVGLRIDVYRGGSHAGTAYVNGETGELGLDIQPLDRLVLTLYHSYVISEEYPDIFDLSFTFEDSTGQPIHGQQLLLDDVELTLHPSYYTVVYHAGSDGKIIKDPGSFVSGDTVTVSGTAAEVFGNIVLPTMTGYSHKTEVAGAQQWYQTDASGVLIHMSGAEVTVTGMPVYDAEGVLHLYADWDAILQALLVDASIIAGWTVEYRVDGGAWTVVNAGEYTEIPYHAEIRFVPTPDADYASFTKLDINGRESIRLDFDIAMGEDGSYIWLMPDADVHVVFSNVLELFLDHGSIVLMPGYFYQSRPGSIWHPWAGNYVIRQNMNDDVSTPTLNTLFINGDMTGKTVSLGKLSISGMDSISLANYPDAYGTFEGAQLSAVGINVTLTLTADISLANILVPRGGSLTVEGGGNSMVLEPRDGASAIGQATDAAGSRITVRECMLTVLESGEYVGIWFGGVGAESVTFEDITLTQPTPDNGIGGRYAFYANNITLTDCYLGTAELCITEPIYAVNSLSITGGELYMQPMVPQGAVSMIGTGSSGTVNIYGAARVIIHYDGSYRSNLPFTGTMKLHDMDARVIIDNMLVLDLFAFGGNIEIGETTVSTGGYEIDHSGNYIILQEMGDTAYLISVSADKTVVLVQPYSGRFYISSLDIINGAVRLQSQAAADGTPLSLELTTLFIGADCTLNARLSDGDTIIFDGSAFDNCNGLYTQSKGNISSSGTVGCMNMDIELDGVTVSARSLIARNLSLTSSAVTCDASGVVGSYGTDGGHTTVTLSGDTSVTAGTVGALGAKNDTYIKVVVQGDSVYVKGTLVRDIYRITYVLQDGYTPVNADTVLRTVETYDGYVTEPVGGTTVSEPEVIPGKTDKFVTWYIVSADGKLSLMLQDAVNSKYHDKFAGFRSGMSAADLVYTTTGADGLPVLTVYAFYSISGTVVVGADQQFGAFSGAAAVTVTSDRGWSAFLTVEATRELGENYAVTFSTKLPVGTRLILVLPAREATGDPMFYYYIVGESTGTTILFSEFAAMGTGNALVLGSSTSESEGFILAVDYTYSASAASTVYHVTFGYKANATAAVEELCAADVTVERSDNNASLERNDNKVTVTLPDNADHDRSGYAYGILVSVNNSSSHLPYTAQPTLTVTDSSREISGTLLGGDMILFVLGEASGNLDTDFTVSGLPSGYDYTWSVVLLQAPQRYNVLRVLSN